jgi:hypothetical protein
VPAAVAQPLGGIDLWSSRDTSAAAWFGAIARSLAVAGPALVAGLVGFVCVRRGSRVSAAAFGGMAGPLLIVAAFHSRASTLVDGNAAWAWVAAAALAVSVVGASAGAALADARQRPDGT